MLEWITAIGTLAAAVVPLALFLVERRDRIRAEAARDLAERERDRAVEEFRARELVRAEQRDNELREEAAREQASKVHVWYGIVDDEPHFYFLNRSSAPVSDVCLDVMAGFKPPNHRSRVSQRVLLARVVLPPTDTKPEEYVYDELMFYADFDQPRDDWELDPVLAIRAIRFTDANGVDWMREMTGWRAGPLQRFERWPVDVRPQQGVD